MRSKFTSRYNNCLWLLMGFGFAIVGIVIGHGLRRSDGKDRAHNRKTEARIPSEEDVRKNDHPEKKFELNWDVIGIASVAVTLVGTAVFFIAGWFYEARWYSYYGLEVSQFDLNPARVMVQGTPGIMLLLLCISIVAIIFYVMNFFKWSTAFLSSLQNISKYGDDHYHNSDDVIQFSKNNLLTVGMYACFVALGIIITASIFVGTLGRGSFPPWEVGASIIFGSAILMTLILVSQFNSIFKVLVAIFTDDFSKVPESIFAWLLASPFFVVMRVPLVRHWFSPIEISNRILSRLNQPQKSIILDAIMERSLREQDIPIINENELWVVNQIAQIKTSPSKDILNIGKIIFRFQGLIAERMFVRFAHYLTSILSRFGFIFVILFLLLISISASTLLAEFDARRGARLLSGDWHLPMTFLLAKEPVSVLNRKKYGPQTEGFIYGPFALVTSNNEAWYLTDWKETEYFQERPVVYIVPREPNQNLFISYPTATPRPEPSPTPIPTATPTPTEVPATTHPSNSE